MEITKKQLQYIGISLFFVAAILGLFAYNQWIYAGLGLLGVLLSIPYFIEKSKQDKGK